MKITEPTTMVTNYAIAAETLIFAVLLLSDRRLNKEVSIRLWAVSFIATAMAAILGGIYHGFSLYQTETTQLILSKAIDYFISLASSLMLLGATVASVSRQLQRWFYISIVLKFVIYIFLTINTDDFRYAIADYVSTMFLVLILQVRAAYIYKAKSASWVCAGIPVSFVAAGIQQSGFKISENFNYNDLFHIVQMGGFYLFYSGAKRLKDY